MEKGIFFSIIMLFVILCFTACDAEVIQKVGETGAAAGTNIYNPSGNASSKEEAKEKINAYLEEYLYGSGKYEDYYDLFMEAVVCINSACYTERIRNDVMDEFYYVSPVTVVKAENDFDESVKQLKEYLEKEFSDENIKKLQTEINKCWTEIEDYIKELLSMKSANSEYSTYTDVVIVSTVFLIVEKAVSLITGETPLPTSLGEVMQIVDPIMACLIAIDNLTDSSIYNTVKGFLRLLEF